MSDKLAGFFRSSPDVKTNASPVLITVALVWFAVIQNTQPVSPAANRRIECACGDVNTATGAGALHNNTIGMPQHSQQC